MRAALAVFLATAALAQQPDAVYRRAADSLNWTFTAGPPAACPAAPVCRLATATPEALAAAARAGARTAIIATATPALLQAADASNITLALDAATGPLTDPARALAAAAASPRIRIWADPAAWDRAGVRALAAIYMLREKLAGATVSAGTVSDEFLKEAYRLDIKPLVWSVTPDAQTRTVATADALVAYHQQYASRTSGVRRLGTITAEERAQMESVIPATAPAKPKKSRKLLVFDLNVGRFGHPSIPYANLAMQLMGSKTGAWTATVSSDPAVLQPASLRQYDAVYLNNTIGDIFSTAEVRDAFASYIAGGGGLMGNHATTVTMTEWPEFGNILGARGASHRMTDENLVIRVEDPAHPLTKAFAPGPFEYADEFFRFQPPYSRDKVRVLLSVDHEKSNMSQGRCYGNCLRDDNDYPVAWIKTYGKGRVFYTTLGHNPHVFQNGRMLEFFLAATQYALGDLDADATPRSQPTADVDAILRDLSKWDRGQDQKPVRAFDRALYIPEPKLIAFLTEAGPSVAAKEIVCRRLAETGTATSVPALAKLLDNAKTAEMARYALELIPGPEATAALHEALDSAPNARVQIGLLYSLARRRDAKLAGALHNLLDTNDPATAAATRNALGLLGTPQAEASLKSVRLTAETADALLNLAEAAPADRAVPIYRKLAETMPAGLHGLARRAPAADAVPVLTAALSSRQYELQSAAITELARISPSSLMSAVPKLAPPAARALAIWQLQSRAVAAEALRDTNAEVLSAALATLAETGTAADVPALLPLAASNPAAVYALTRIRGIDAALVAALENAPPAQKPLLIRIVGERSATSAAPALLAAAKSSDPKLRREAIRGLRSLAAPEHIPSLLQLVASTEEDDQQDAATALAAAVRRTDKPDLRPVFTAYRSAKKDEHRAALLTSLAATGHNDAIAVLREAAADARPDVARAAVTGLADWPTADPLPDLLNIVQSAQASQPLRVLALRGFVRQARLPSGRKPSETAKLLGIAMKAATRAEDKKAVLGAIQRTPAPESLELARAAAADPELAEEAKIAIAALERQLAPRRN